jgi:two-component system response regulator RegA
MTEATMTTTATVARVHSILLVDDDEPFRERMARALRLRGFAVWVAGELTSAAEAARSARPDFAVVDMRMPDATGYQVVEAIVLHSPQTRIVILTGYGSIASAVEALHRGAHQYLSKPLDADELVAALGRLGGPGLTPEPPSSSGPASASEKTAAGEDPTPSLARAEWEHIQRVLGDVDGNVSEAARRLGIARRTLQLKLKKYPPRT